MSLELRKTTGSSMASGGAYRHILSEDTVTMHLNTYRCLVQVLLDAELLEKPVSFRDALTKDSWLAFLTHLETATASRGRAYAPASVNNLSRSLSVWLEVVVACAYDS